VGNEDARKRDGRIMEGFEKVFKRRFIRLKGYDYSQPGAYL